MQKGDTVERANIPTALYRCFAADGTLVQQAVRRREEARRDNGEAEIRLATVMNRR